MRGKNIKKLKKVVQSYGFVFMGAMLYAIGLHGFLQHAKSLSSAGASANESLVTVIIKAVLPYVSAIYIALNIPIVILYWNKNKRTFMNRTCFYLMCQGVFGSLFFIPEVVAIFGIIFGAMAAISKMKFVIVIEAVLGVLLMGIGVEVCWKNGGSIAGFDILSYYHFKRRTKKIREVVLVMTGRVALALRVMNQSFSNNFASFSLELPFDKIFSKIYAYIAMTVKRKFEQLMQLAKIFVTLKLKIRNLILSSSIKLFELNKGIALVVNSATIFMKKCVAQLFASQEIQNNSSPIQLVFA